MGTRRRPDGEIQTCIVSRLRAFTSVVTLRRSDDACTLHHRPLGAVLDVCRQGGLHLGGNPPSGMCGAPSLGAHLRGVALDRGAEQAARMVLNQSQIGQGDEPAEVILCHDLCGVRVPGVVRHVVDGRVGHKVVHVVAASVSRTLKVSLKNLSGCCMVGRRSRRKGGRGRVAVDDILHEVGGPSLPRRGWLLAAESLMASTRNTLKLSRLETSSWMPRMAALRP